MYKIGEIRELIRLLDETSVTELKIEVPEMKLLIKKSESGVVRATEEPMHAPAPIHFAPAPGVVTTTAAQDVESPDDATIHVILSPMVGTFYQSPAPDSPPFAEIGGKVSAKSIVCIVEAMKLMNEIEAEVSGEVVEVLAQNGQLVEYGQPLFKIKLA